MRGLEGMKKPCSVQKVVLSGVVVRRITTYVPHICRTVRGGVSTSGVCMIHANCVHVCMCVHGRSCQGLIECLYMTSSCWGLGRALGKVENNERRTAAKHNRIHLYLPTAACLCVWTAPVCHHHARYTPSTQTTRCRGREQVCLQQLMVGHHLVC